MKKFFVIIVMQLIAFSVFSQVDFNAMLKELDVTQDFSGNDFSCRWTILVEKPNEKLTKSVIDIFRRDSQNKLVYILREPVDQAGQAFLKIDDNLWIYDPKTGKDRHTTFKQEVANSDAKNSDIRKTSLVDDYSIEKTEEGVFGSRDVWILTLKAKNDEVTYAKMKLYVYKKVPIILKEEDYSVSNQLMRILTYTKYQSLNKKYIPAEIVIEDQVNPGEKTTVTISNVSIATLPEYTFTRQILQKSSTK